MKIQYDAGMTINRKAYTALTLTIIFWASAFVGIRYCLRDYAPGDLALFRYLIASVVMLLFYLRVPNKTVPKLRELISMMLCGVIGFTIYNIALGYGEQTVTAGIAGFIVGQMPILIAIAAIFIFKEHLSKMAYVGFVISLVGIILIAMGESDKGHFDMGVLYTIIATIAGACYALLQKPLLKRFSPIEFTTFAIWGGTLALFFYWPSMLHQIPHAHWRTNVFVVYMGIFPGALAYAGWCYGFSKMPAAKAGSFLYASPIIATIMAYIIMGEMPHGIALLGGLIALVGAVLVNRAKQKV
mgnify:CR=1 FL=1